MAPVTSLESLWTNWAFLWLLFWLVLSTGMTSLTPRYTGAACTLQGLYTGCLPALILLGQRSYFTAKLAIIIAIVVVATDVVFLRLVKTKAATDTAPAY
jgi:hypothetical protein